MLSSDIHAPTKPSAQIILPLVLLTAQSVEAFTQSRQAYSDDFFPVVSARPLDFTPIRFLPYLFSYRQNNRTESFKSFKSLNRSNRSIFFCGPLCLAT